MLWPGHPRDHPATATRQLAAYHDMIAQVYRKTAHQYQRTPQTLDPRFWKDQQKPKCHFQPDKKARQKKMYPTDQRQLAQHLNKRPISDHLAKSSIKKQ